MIESLAAGAAAPVQTSRRSPRQFCEVMQPARRSENRSRRMVG